VNRVLAAFGLIVVATAALTASSAVSATGDRSLDLPAWSPDGTQIAWGSVPFGSTDGGSAAQIWTAAADGSGARPLIGGLRDGLFEIVWPQPGTLLYDANFQVFRAGTDRSHKVVLPDTGSTFTTDTEGDRVASSCDRCNGPIVVVTVATGKRVTIGGKGSSNADPTFSPDGSRIGFDHAVYNKAKDQYVGGGLWISNANGTGMHQISKAGGCASWSPAGSAIAYLALGQASLNLRTIAPDGSRSRLLVTKGPTCSVPSSLSWSPNGKQIAYIDSKTGRLIVLQVASRHTSPIGKFRSVTGVAWSPDSTQLLVTARPSPATCSSLWRVGADGSSPQLLVRC
jgi:Tol biopolymer transport system component